MKHPKKKSREAIKALGSKNIPSELIKYGVKDMYSFIFEPWHKEKC